MQRAKKILLLAFGIMFLMGVGVLYAVLFTSLPLKLVVDQAVSQSEGKISYQSLNGSLMSGLSFEGLQIEDEAFNLNFPSARFTYGGLPTLFSGALLINEFACSNCKIQLKKSPITSKETTKQQENKPASEDSDGVDLKTMLAALSSGKGGGLTIEKIDFSNFILEAAPGAQIPMPRFSLDRFLMDFLVVAPGPEGTLITLQNLDLNSSLLGAQIRGLSWNPKLKILSWDQEISLQIDPRQSMGISKGSAIDLRVSGDLKPGYLGNLKLLAFKGAAELNWDTNLGQAKLNVRALNPADFMNSVLPLLELTAEAEFDGPFMTWSMRPFKSINFKWGQRSFNLVEASLPSGAAGPLHLLRDETGSYEFQMPFGLTSFPPKRLIIKKSSDADLKESLSTLQYGQAFATLDEEKQKEVDRLLGTKMFEAAEDVLFSGKVAPVLLPEVTLTTDPAVPAQNQPPASAEVLDRAPAVDSVETTSKAPDENSASANAAPPPPPTPKAKKLRKPAAKKQKSKKAKKRKRKVSLTDGLN